MADDQSSKRAYDLEERTAKFGEMVIGFANKIPKNVITLPMISQLVRAGTSVGANYCEALCAESPKDFEHKLGICKKEAKEAKHWVRMIVYSIPRLEVFGRSVWQASHELQLIFIASVATARHNRALSTM